MLVVEYYQTVVNITGKGGMCVVQVGYRVPCLPRPECLPAESSQGAFLESDRELFPTQSVTVGADDV